MKESIGDAQGKAATLHQMASIYANQGQVDQALDLYQQSLQIKESIGNAQGKAATLAMMGQLRASQGEFGQAIIALQESLAILQHIRSHEASKVARMLKTVQQRADLRDNP
jgi:tetratricopeptide (TPR) repeat protein